MLLLLTNVGCCRSIESDVANADVVFHESLSHRSCDVQWNDLHRKRREERRVPVYFGGGGTYLQRRIRVLAVNVGPVVNQHKLHVAHWSVGVKKETAKMLRTVDRAQTDT